MSIFEYLNLRTEYEEILSKFIVTPVQSVGTVNGMKDFLENGGPKNRFRDGYDRAIEIANLVTRASW